MYMASRLNASYVSILQRFCDVLAIYAALYIVFNLNSLEITHQAMLVFLCMVSLFQLIGGLTDFYRSWRGISLFNELVACLKNVLMSSCLLLPFVWFYSDINIALLIQYFCAVLFLMGVMRVFVRLIYTISFKIFKKSRNVIVIGDSSKALKLFNDLKRSEWIGFNPLGVFSFNSNYNTADYNGTADNAVDIIQNQDVNQV